MRSAREESAGAPKHCRHQSAGGCPGAVLGGRPKVAVGIQRRGWGRVAERPLDGDHVAAVSDQGTGIEVPQIVQRGVGQSRPAACDAPLMTGRVAVQQVRPLTETATVRPPTHQCPLCARRACRLVARGRTPPVLSRTSEAPPQHRFVSTLNLAPDSDCAPGAAPHNSGPAAYGRPTVRRRPCAAVGLSHSDTTSDELQRRNSNVAAAETCGKRRTTGCLGDYVQ